MNEFERSLTRLQPAAAGLDADRVLFDAGLAAGRRGRRWWLAATGSLTVLSLCLAAWAWSERSERRELTNRVVESPAFPASPPVGHSLEPSSAASADGYLHLRRQAEQDPNGWPASWQTAEVPGPALPDPVILRAWQRNAPIDQ